MTCTKSCKLAAVVFVSLLVICLAIFCEAVYTPGPDRMEVTMKAFFFQGEDLQNSSYYLQSGREIYSVREVVYYWHDSKLTIQILGDTTPPSELKYLNRNWTDKLLCEVHIKPSKSLQNELGMSALSEGSILFTTNQNTVCYGPYYMHISGDFYEAEYPIDPVLLKEPMGITIVMKFDIGKIKTNYDLQVSTQIINARGVGQYPITLQVPSDFNWTNYPKTKDENPPKVEDEYGYLTFDSQGNENNLSARIERPRRFDLALILSVVNIILGASADAFYRLCSPKKWVKERLKSIKKT